MGCAPGCPGVAPVFASCAEDRNSDACCVRPRSRGGHEHFRLRTRRVFDARSFGEVATEISPKSFGLLEFAPDAALQRLKRVGDLFAPMLKLKQKLPKEFTRLTSSKPRQRPRSLEAYDVKRNFARTTEPTPDAPRRSRQGSRRRFV